MCSYFFLQQFVVSTPDVGERWSGIQPQMSALQPATPCLTVHVVSQVAKNHSAQQWHFVVRLQVIHATIIPSAPDVILVGNNGPKLEQMLLSCWGWFIAQVLKPSVDQLWLRLCPEFNPSKVKCASCNWSIWAGTNRVQEHNCVPPVDWPLFNQSQQYRHKNKTTLPIKKPFWLANCCLAKL